MGNKIRTRILVGRGKGRIHMLLHIPRSNNYRRLLVPNFLVVLSKDNVHICKSKSHELNCGYFDTLVKPTLFYGVETWGLSLNKANN